MRLPFVSVERENGAPPPPSIGTGEGKATGLQTDGNAIQEVTCHLPLLCAGHTRAKQVTASGLANAPVNKEDGSPAHSPVGRAGRCGPRSGVWVETDPSG